MMTPEWALWEVSTKGDRGHIESDGQCEGRQGKKRRRSVEERRKIVEETLQPGASVARVARQHDVNANQVFHWRKLYREGLLGSTVATKLLPVFSESCWKSFLNRLLSRTSRNSLPASSRSIHVLVWEAEA